MMPWFSNRADIAKLRKTHDCLQACRHCMSRFALLPQHTLGDIPHDL
jgi:hypothetical protein